MGLQNSTMRIIARRNAIQPYVLYQCMIICQWAPVIHFEHYRFYLV